ncbi:hypothetical protein R4004_002594 [Escherichia coli]|uniref:hypothetical protein n=1 Tax=Escherichia coli TaxID=562 RepID=UPI001B272A64|nr:hypothetical protein [Escherichia coli]UWG72892.1 MAG: hypothetical protein [Bacteriophage sp.]EJB9165693.1 hypothetical protein [Escherichia coli]ELS0572824.1 hypothetical protein [Escherichia coli]MCK0651203.1 hypothetical protein [Escherichia coli]HAZ7370222.1 hypothetical protein [Escherichia coli]
MIWISYTDGTMLYTAGTRYEVQEDDKKFIVKTFDKDDNLLLELTYKVGEVSSIQLDCGHKDNPLKKPGVGKASEERLSRIAESVSAQKSKKGTRK